MPIRPIPSQNPAWRLAQTPMARARAIPLPFHPRFRAPSRSHAARQKSTRVKIRARAGARMEIQNVQVTARWNSHNSGRPPRARHAARERPAAARAAAYRTAATPAPPNVSYRGKYRTLVSHSLWIQGKTVGT